MIVPILLYFIITTPMIRQYEFVETVDATMYNAVIEQCEGNPLQTADGSMIDLDLLSNDEIHWIAISRDMHVRYGGNIKFGQTIYVKSKYEELNRVWVVRDLMNERFEKKIDFLQCKETGFYGKWNNIKIYKTWKKSILEILCLHLMRQDCK